MSPVAPLAVDDLDDPRLADYRLMAQPETFVQRHLLLVEGRLILPRLLEAPHLRVQSILLSQGAWQALGSSLERLAAVCPIAACPIYVMPQARMNALVGFDIHRGCLALAQRPLVPLLSAIDLSGARRLVVLEGVSNPDNMGGVFRNAAAFGTDLIVLGPGCADPWYRKAIRTSMGATLGVPFALAGAWPEALHQLRTQGWRVAALTPAVTAAPLSSEAATTSRVTLLLGAEGDGLSAAAQQAADVRLRIPIHASIDSLNVAVAAAIALHHFTAETPGG